MLQNFEKNFASFLQILLSDKSLTSNNFLPYGRPLEYWLK